MNRLIATAAFISATALFQSTVEASVARISTPANHQLTSTSRNDKWGVGYIGDGSEGETKGFRWNLVTGKVEDIGTLNDAGGIAVDNNGTVYACYKYTDTTGASHVAPGYYQNGVWHNMPVPEGVSASGLDACCSADGRFVSMTLTGPNGRLTPVVWRDGIPAVVKTNGDHSRVECISEDGSILGGWMNTDNRQSTIWRFDGTGYNAYENIGDSPDPFENVWAITSDNKYALATVGWDYEYQGENCRYYGLYNIETKELQYFTTPDSDGMEIRLSGLSDDLYTVGEYGGEASIIAADGMIRTVKDWLKTTHNVDITEFPEIITYENVFRLFRASSVNKGANRLGLVYYGTYPGVEDYYPFYSMYLVLDADPDEATPLDIRVSKMPGISTVSLEWDIPFACRRTITGYNIYRDGTKINDTPVTEKEFYDVNVPTGIHTYRISTVCDGGETPQSESVSFEMTEALSVNAPAALTARQRGYNRVDLDWNAPDFNSGYLTYCDNDSQTEGLGTSLDGLSMEAAIQFPAKQMALYNGATLKSVSFVPLSACDEWNICLYRPTASGKPREVYSQKITQELAYGEPNVIDLTNPYTIDGNELIIAVRATANNANLRIFGYQPGKAKAGYSDLLRNYDGSGTPFESFYDASEKVYGSGISMSWKISGNFIPAGVDGNIDTVTSYSITEDGMKIADTRDTEFIIEDVTEGEHTYAVCANYATGSSSKDATAPVTVNTTSMRKPIAAPAYDYDSDKKELNVSWTAPADDDATAVTYATGAINDQFKPFVPGSNELYAGVEFPANLYKTYRGYEIRSISFVPAADADFSYQVLQDGKVVTEGEVDSYILHKWNKVMLDRPIEFNPLSDYQVLLNAYDYSEGNGPFHTSTDELVPNRGDLLSMDGEEWYTVLELSGQSYNWMIAMDIAETDSGRTLPVERYDVILDNKRVNGDAVTGTEYKVNTTLTSSQPLRIDAYYPGCTDPVKGTEVMVIVTSGVDGTQTVNVSVNGGNGCILVRGDEVTGVEVYDTTGRLVARGRANTARIDGIAPGIYAVKATVNGKKTVIAKINVL